jgi:hypothetical protein
VASITIGGGLSGTTEEQSSVVVLPRFDSVEGSGTGKKDST